MSGKYVVVYNILEVARGNMPEKSLRDYIKDLILQNNGQLWTLMEPYFVPPGKEGRRDYDHAEAIAHLKRESRSTSREKKMPDPLENLNTSALVPHVLKVLKVIGFVVNRGKIVGTKVDLEEDLGSGKTQEPIPANEDEAEDEAEDLRMAA